jgi:hypothetical protein
VLSKSDGTPELSVVHSSPSEPFTPAAGVGRLFVSRLLGGGLFSERPMTRKSMGRFVLEDGLQGIDQQAMVLRTPDNE